MLRNSDDMLSDLWFAINVRNDGETVKFAKELCDWFDRLGYVPERLAELGYTKQSARHLTRIIQAILYKRS